MLKQRRAVERQRRYAAEVKITESAKTFLERRSVSGARETRYRAAYEDFMLWCRRRGIATSGHKQLDEAVVKWAHEQFMVGERAPTWGTRSWRR